MKKWLFSFIVFSVFSACGPSVAEMIEKENLKHQLIELRTQLAGEETRLKKVKGFQLLRTKWIKEQQVSDQTKVVEGLKLRIADVQEQLSGYQNF